MLVKTHWAFCPRCGSRTRIEESESPTGFTSGKENSQDEPRRAARERLAAAIPPGTATPFPGAGPGAYGAGVRAQVFEVIVRQALGGAPWEEICAGPMSVCNINPQEVKDEVARRRTLLHKGTDTKKKTEHDPKKTSNRAGDPPSEDSEDDNDPGMQPARVPKKPIKPSGDTDKRLAEPHSDARDGDNRSDQERSLE